MIKSTITEAETKDEYPRLMKSKTGAEITYFIDSRRGFVVKKLHESDYSEGEFRSDWIASAFEDFNGTIQLSNLT